MPSFLVYLIIGFHSSNVFLLEIFTSHDAVLILYYLAKLVVFGRSLRHSFIDIILPLLYDSFLIGQRKRVYRIDFALIVFNFLALLDCSLEWDTESLELLLY